MGSSSSTASTQERQPAVLLHRLHGENVQISPDWKSVKRIRGFEQSICFSNKPIVRNRYIDLRIMDTDPSWRGVLRFGVMTVHPGTLRREHLPTCACPGLQERDGFWVDSVPEALACKGNEIYFYVTNDGDVMCGVTTKGKRQAFGEEVLIPRTPKNKELWIVIELYGQTTDVQLFEPPSALTVLQAKPQGASSQRDRSAKLPNNGKEDPLVENSINIAIMKQREESGEGSSTGATAAYMNDQDNEHPEPKPVGMMHTEQQNTQDTREESPVEARAIVSAPTRDAETPVEASASPGAAEASASPGAAEASCEAAKPAAECTVCLDAPTECALYRCGHVCMCHKCATDLMKNPEPLCPVCRKPVEDVIKTFQS